MILNRFSEKRLSDNGKQLIKIWRKNQTQSLIDIDHLKIIKNSKIK